MHQSPPAICAALVLAPVLLLSAPSAQAQRYDPRLYDPVAPTAPADAGHRERVEVRLNALESELRSVTGRVEELSHTVQRLQQRFEKLVQDIDFRLTGIERSLHGSQNAAAVPQTPPRAAAGSAAVGESREPAAPTARPSDPVAVGPAPGARDPAAAADRPQSREASAARPLPAGPAMDMYERARQLMSQTRYDDAEAAYREFLSRYPDHQLSGNARYWLGETYYVRKRYEEAATAFLDAYQSDPKGGKSADNLLKLGLSLAAIQRTREACVALEKLLREHPDVEGHILRRAEQERSQLACA